MIPSRDPCFMMAGPFPLKTGCVSPSQLVTNARTIFFIRSRSARLGTKADNTRKPNLSAPKNKEDVPAGESGKRLEKPNVYLDVRKTLDKIKDQWAEAKSQSPPADTKIRESSEGGEKPASKTDDPFLWLRKFPRLAKRGRGRGPHKWFGR